jgi:hypothetical protein
VLSILNDDRARSLGQSFKRIQDGTVHRSSAQKKVHRNGPSRRLMLRAEGLDLPFVRYIEEFVSGVETHCRRPRGRVSPYHATVSADLSRFLGSAPASQTAAVSANMSI